MAPLQQNYGGHATPLYRNRKTSSKIRRGRGRAQASIELIEAMYAIAKEAQPITGVGYKLFTMKLIPDMSVKSMARLYPLLKEAREQGIIPWEWIVDETRELERASSLDDPDDYVRTISRAYRRDFWRHQPVSYRTRKETKSARHRWGRLL